MKFLFLDIDGVLNHKKHYNEIYESHMPYSYPCSEFNKHSIELLNKIVENTDCKIILSSTWRLDENIVNIFEKVGFKFGIYGKTPYICNGLRGEEIKSYLDNYPEVINYAILDDETDFLEEQKEHLFKTNAYSDGLNDKITDNIIKYLNSNEY